MRILKKEKEILNTLALQVSEIASSPKFDILREQWKNHNDMVSQQAPMVLVYPDQDGVWSELILEEELQCSHPILRKVEFLLKQKIYRNEYFKDDFVIEPDIILEIPGIYSGHHYGMHNKEYAWGLKLITEKKTDKFGAYSFAPVLDSEESFENFFSHQLDFSIDEEEYTQQHVLLEELLAGTGINIKWEIPYVALVCSLSIELVHLRGLENIYLDLYDNPERLFKVFHHMGKQKANLLDSLESKGLLVLNNEDHWTGSGGVGYSNTLLPRNGDEVKLSNLWGFADAQEFSNVSHDMWNHFVLKNQSPALRKFGYSCYGCCEPVDGKYDYIFKELPNIRRISVSPWADISAAVDNIGQKAIYSRKPNPSEICFGFDYNSVRKEMEEFVDLTKDCFTEIILKDLRSCNGDATALREWIKITMDITKGA